MNHMQEAITTMYSAQSVSHLYHIVKHIVLSLFKDQFQLDHAGAFETVSFGRHAEQAQAQQLPQLATIFLACRPLAIVLQSNENICLAQYHKYQQQLSLEAQLGLPHTAEKNSSTLKRLTVVAVIMTAICKRSQRNPNRDAGKSSEIDPNDLAKLCVTFDHAVCESKRFDYVLAQLYQVAISIRDRIESGQYSFVDAVTGIHAWLQTYMLSAIPSHYALYESEIAGAITAARAFDKKGELDALSCAMLIAETMTEVYELLSRLPVHLVRQQRETLFSELGEAIASNFDPTVDVKTNCNTLAYAVVLKFVGDNKECLRALLVDIESKQDPKLEGAKNALLNYLQCFECQFKQNRVCKSQWQGVVACSFFKRISTGTKRDLVPTSLTFTTREVERLRRFGYISAGVVFHEELAGPDGMSFVLIAEDHIAPNMYLEAVKKLRCDRDVVGAIRIAKIDDCQIASSAA